MTEIRANELKTKSVSTISAAPEPQTETIISVRGKDRLVVMDAAHR